VIRRRIIPYVATGRAFRYEAMCAHEFATPLALSLAESVHSRLNEGEGCFLSAQGSSGSGRDSKEHAQDEVAAHATGASSIAPDKRAHLLTSHAQEAVNSAELINSAFKKRVVGSALPRRVEVAPPSGPSTSGGKKARQPITLVQPAVQAPAVMIGFLDVGQKVAGLRGYELVSKLYEGRFRAGFETSKDEYEALRKDLVGMLETLGFKVVSDEPREVEARGPEEEAVQAAAAPASYKPFYIAGGIVAAALLLLLLTRC
jgi:hypothetical protein